MQYKKLAAHKHWHDWLARQGCAIEPGTPAEIDHFLGASTKSEGLWIGQYATIPLCYYWHRDPQNPNNRTNNPAGFEDTNTTVKQIFSEQVTKYMDEHETMPMPLEIYNAIMNYSRWTRTK